jgi:WD40 repeat protein
MNSPLILDAHGKHAQAVHFTRDGKRLVSCGQDAKVRVWSVPGFKAERALDGHEKSVNSLSFTADERLLASGSSDPAVRVWSIAEGRSLYELAKQTTGVFSPNGEHLATISSGGKVVLREGASGKELRELALDKRHLALAFAPSGAFLFVGGTGPIHRVAVPDGTSDGEQRGHAVGVAALCVSPSGSVLASTGLDGTLRFWTVVGGDEVSAVPLGSSGVFQLAFAPDGRSVAVSVDGAVLRLTAPEGHLIERNELEVKGVYGVAFSPDGRKLACAAADGRVRVWEIP